MSGAEASASSTQSRLHRLPAVVSLAAPAVLGATAVAQAFAPSIHAISPVRRTIDVFTGAWGVIAAALVIGWIVGVLAVLPVVPLMRRTSRPLLSTKELLLTASLIGATVVGSLGVWFSFSYMVY